MAFHTGLTRTIDASNKANHHHLVLDMDIKAGKSWNFGQVRQNSGELTNTTCYTLVGGGTQIGRVNQGYRLRAGTDIGCIHYANEICVV